MASRSDMPRIAVDAMGGDLGPAAVVPGALETLHRTGGFELVLYGEPAVVDEQLAGLDLPPGDVVSVVSCSQNIAMSDSPASAIRQKADSPIVRAMKDQKAGQVDAVVSAGSTGAMVAASLIILGRLPSVDRPCIATLIPTVDSEFLLLDVGANTQCKPGHLVRFAEMGDLYCREMLEVAKPRVGLLNIGEESSKGTDQLVETHGRLAESGLEFCGNVEPNRILLGVADVVVTDGFTGNVILKQVEGFGRYMAALAQSEVLEVSERQSLLPALGVLKKRFNYELYGGALLLGIAGVSIICHGRSSSLAIQNAVAVALRQVQLDMPGKLRALPTRED